MTQQTLLDLPREIVERILLWVDTPTRLRSVTRLSRDYQQISNEATSWTAISFGYDKSSNSLCDMFQPYLLTYYLPRWRFITHLDLRNCNHIHDQAMLYVWLHCHSLTHLWMDRCTGITDQTFEAMADVARCASYLECISVNQCDRLTSQAFIDIGNVCVALTALSLDDCDVDNRALSTISKCAHLRSLSVAHCDFSPLWLSSLTSRWTHVIDWHPLRWSICSTSITFASWIWPSVCCQMNIYSDYCKDYRIWKFWSCTNVQHYLRSLYKVYVSSTQCWHILT
jgi:hypothetical protein